MGMRPVVPLISLTLDFVLEPELGVPGDFKSPFLIVPWLLVVGMGIPGEWRLLEYMNSTSNLK